MENQVNYNTEKLKDILSNVRICTQLYCTVNGKIHSIEAESYLSWINEYSKYCLPEMVNSWQEVTRHLIYSPLVLRPGVEVTPEIKTMIDINEYNIIRDLYDFMNAGKIMQVYDETASWEEVDKVLNEQGHSGYSFSGLSNMMILYSPIGVDFIERYEPSRIKRDKEFKKYYDKAKEYNANRKELNKRLVYALSKKINYN